MILAALARLIAALALSAMVGGNVSARVTIFAASSLATPIDRSLSALPPDIDAVTSYAGSQTLARQIAVGAPADIVISANKTWMDYLIDNGLVDRDEVQVFIRNRLVAIAPAARSDNSSDLNHLLTSNPGLRLAIGEPASVPVGIYAKQALQSRGLWPLSGNKVIAAESARTALLWVELGEADIGIVYASDAAQSSKVTILGEFLGQEHDPITYPIAPITGRKTTEVQTVLDHLMSQATTQLLLEMGFTER